MKALVLAILLAASPARADERCTAPYLDDSEVVGYRQCPHYGMCGHRLTDPYVFVDVGFDVRELAQPTSTAIARTTAPIAPAASSQRVVTFDERIGFDLVHRLYAAFDFELGDFDVERPSNIFVLGGTGSLGLRATLGFVALAGELTGGVLETSLSTRAATDVAGIAEARVRADVWLGPWITVGAFVGTSVLERDERLAGIYLGVHTWGYAGDRWR